MMRRSISLDFQYFHMILSLTWFSQSGKVSVGGPTSVRGFTPSAVLILSIASSVGWQLCETWRPVQTHRRPESVSQRFTWAGPRHCLSHSWRLPCRKKCCTVSTRASGKLLSSIPMQWHPGCMATVYGESIMTCDSFQICLVWSDWKFVITLSFGFDPQVDLDGNAIFMLP